MNWLCRTLAWASIGACLASEPQPGRIDAWPLEAPSWRSARGISPLSLRGAESVSGLQKGALQIRAQARSAGLEYPVLGAGFSQTTRFDQGTLRFLYRPGWDTARGGPGRDSVLMQLQTAGSQPRGFRWQVNAAGTQLEWRQFDGQQETLLTRGGIRWASNTWVVITAVYGGSLGPTLYTNGAVTRVGELPVKPPDLPNPTLTDPVRLRIGSGSPAGAAVSGAFDAVELFAAPLGPALLETDLKASLWATVETNAAAVELHWRAQPGLSFSLRRFQPDTSSWTVLATDLSQWSFRDASVDAGGRYAYALKAETPGTLFPLRYLPVGIELAPVHSQGRVLLLVDETLAGEIEEDLALLRRDLIAEGWWPVQARTPRHVDSVWSENPPLIEAVRQRVEEEYRRPGPPLKALYLLGHVPVPHSGFVQPDGHAPRPLPADGFYGDLERGANDWTDTATYRAGPTQIGGGPAAIPNLPGDGIFDQRNYPSPLEVAVGRVDFANLPTFTQRPPPGVRPVSEPDLLRRYLDKARRYRRGRLLFPERVAVHRTPPPIYNGFYAAQSPLRNLLAWFGDASWRLEEVDPFREGRSRGFLLASVSGYGGFAHIGLNPSGRWTTADLADPDKEPSVGFYFLDGSYLGDYNLAARPIPDTLLRAALAPPNSGLAAVWHRLLTSSVVLQSLGLGDPLGSAWWSRLQHPDLDNSSGRYAGDFHLGLLGDPTLRLDVLPPIQELTASRNNGGVTLRWASPVDPRITFAVYRGGLPLDGPPLLLTASLVEGSSYIDRSPAEGPATYLVRPVQLKTTGCGSFYNAGPGSIVEVP